MPSVRVAIAVAACCGLLPAVEQQDPPHVVFLVGEAEYGSRETMPAFAERLADELQLTTTVLHSEERELPALDALDSADLLVLFLRFREADDEQFARLRGWFDAGKPCVALRTTSHAFVANKGWFPPFFGGHYKAHAPNGQGTRSYVVPAASAHPILRGLQPSLEMGHGGTYNAQPLADTVTPLLLGRTGRLPAEPIAWINRYRPDSRIFYTSLGSRENFERDDFQRLLGNAVLWCLGRDVPERGAFGGGGVRAPFEAPSVPPPPPADLPAGATVLFDGSGTTAWRHWDPSAEPLAIGIDGRADSSGGGEQYDAARWSIEDGALVARPGFGDIVTRQDFGDYHLHLDFLVPREPAWSPDAFAGHSGVYLAGRYEIQIADSSRDEVDEWSCGAIHGEKEPDQDAAGRPGSWQSLDIHFRHLQDRAPIVSAWLNGKPIHDRVSLDDRTIYGFRSEPAGARSVAAGDGLLYARSAEESFDFGSGEFTIAARFRSRGSGTIASKSPPAGEWKPNGKTLFLRNGRLVYDIGWVGQMETADEYNDGKWHRVLLTHDDGEAMLFVDGELVADREDFTAPDESGHVFKIGATSPDFGGGYTGEISDVAVWQSNVSVDKAEQWTRGEVVHLGDVELAWQPEESTGAEAEEVEDGRVVVAAPIRLQADSSAVRFANVWLQSLSDVDHRRWASRRDRETLVHGAQLYEALCAQCHVEPRQAFEDGLRHGDDPLAIYRTLEHGAGGKEAMAWIPAGPRYALIHYVRDQLGLPAVDAGYIAALPPGFGRGDAAAAEPDEADWPTYRRTDYGNALHWTYEVGDDNIAYKGIAVRLDPGAGGVSRGRAFMVYDHDTMRVAAAWTGAGFIDWKGVAFDGSHNSHAHIEGEVAFVNPVGPGWADPATGSFQDPRFLGRDGKPYGPLPREWAQFVGRGRKGDATVIEYTVGDARVSEVPGFEDFHGVPLFTRSLIIDGGTRDHYLRVAPTAAAVELQAAPDASRPPPRLLSREGFHVLHVPPGDGVLEVCLYVTSGDPRLLAVHKAMGLSPDAGSGDDEHGPARWRATVTTRARLGESKGAYVVDTLPLPDAEANPWHSWLRLGGIDFFADGRRAAVSTWNGDVWVVEGIGGDLGELRWRRIAAGLFQPLGVRIVDDVIYLGCRDQICVLEDRNGDGETDYYRCFNNDHQVTEHFHEFAMGLQTDAEGNFYYAKSARHAKTALVPHHGTLLMVLADGSRTEIVANGFRAANGVCINGDGSFYVTDQEGHWTPKNRINRVVRGGFYGNMMGYHDRESSADADMEPPLCWITNAFDRSPAELLRVEGDRWGLPAGALLQLSYGTGRVFLVLEDRIGSRYQGGMVSLPIAPFPTGIMRGRFHPGDGQLYCCGLFGWSGARTRPGGLYRVRQTGKAPDMPIAMRFGVGTVELTFGCDLDRELAEDLGSWGVKTWQLRRSKGYGSEHHDTRTLAVTRADLADDDRTVKLTIPDLQPTMCIEIQCNVETPDEEVLRATIHGTIHALR